MDVIDRLLFALTLLAALGCGLMAGLFFAFSVCVMKALERLPSAAGITAMQSINVAIINPVFLAVFFGTAVGCFVRFARSTFYLRDPEQGRDSPVSASKECHLRQLIGHHHPWRSTLVLQHLTEEALRGLFVFTLLNQNVDDVIVLVNSTPEITAFPWTVTITASSISHVSPNRPWRLRSWLA